MLLKAFAGWEPADLVSAVEFRGSSGDMQVQAPAVYLAGLLGKEHRAWKIALSTVWAHLPAAERLRINMLGSRGPGARAQAARITYHVFAVSFGLWAGWSVPRLGHVPWPMDTALELKPPTVERHRAAEAEHAWWNKHVGRNVQNHLGLCPWGLRIGVLSKGRKSGSLLIGNDDGKYYYNTPSARSMHACDLTAAGRVEMTHTRVGPVDLARARRHTWEAEWSSCRTNLRAERSHKNWMGRPQHLTLRNYRQEPGWAPPFYSGA